MKYNHIVYIFICVSALNTHLYGQKITLSSTLGIFSPTLKEFPRYPSRDYKKKYSFNGGLNGQVAIEFKNLQLGLGFSLQYREGFGYLIDTPLNRYKDWGSAVYYTFPINLQYNIKLGKTNGISAGFDWSGLSNGYFAGKTMYTENGVNYPGQVKTPLRYTIRYSLGIVRYNANGNHWDIRVFYESFRQDFSSEKESDIFRKAEPYQNWWVSSGRFIGMGTNYTFSLLPRRR